MGKREQGGCGGGMTGSLSDTQKLLSRKSRPRVEVENERRGEGR